MALPHLLNYTSSCWRWCVPSCLTAALVLATLSGHDPSTARADHYGAAFRPQAPHGAVHGGHPGYGGHPGQPTPADCGPCASQAGWNGHAADPWQSFAQGEYIGPARSSHVNSYRLRVDDQLEFVYRLTRSEIPTAYRLQVGDEVAIESLTDRDINRGDLTQRAGLVIQPDGTITLRLLGQVRAARRTVEELQNYLKEAYRKFYKDPDVLVTPLKVNTRLEDLRAAIDNRFGAGGQSRRATVTPEGTVQLPGIGSVPAQGLTLDELKMEIDERYSVVVEGIEVSPVLVQRAQRFVYVLGEVPNPGRYAMQGPTSAMQAIALAGGWNPGGELKKIIVFRRTADWQMVATTVDLQSTLWGQQVCPADEIWLRDSDLVLIPKNKNQRRADWINLVFTRGLYSLFPFQGVGISVTSASTL